VNGIRCYVCKNNIAAGAAATKMIVEYAQPDSTVKIFGYMMPDGPLSKATGRMVRGYHHKCFWVIRKREARGDAVTGRVLYGVPTAYEIGALVLSREEFEALGLTADQARQQGTAYLTERLDKLRTIARRIGKGVGDATVLEAYWADTHAGPYPHKHHLPLEIYQLRAHLTYAHGLDAAAVHNRDGIRGVHDALHTAAVMAEIEMARETDPGYQAPGESDWREQVVEDVENLR